MEQANQPIAQNAFCISLSVYGALKTKSWRMTRVHLTHQTMHSLATVNVENPE